jgi:hypothetical protein
MTSWLEDMQIESIVADANKGGWEATLNTLQDTDAIAESQEVQLPFRYYSQGWDSDWRTGLVGHALPLGFDFDRITSRSRFSIATSNRFLEHARVQGIPFADQSVCGGGPFNDHQILNMRLGHIVKHILEYHCNISSTVHPEGWVDTSDIDIINSTRLNRLNFHATDNMWAALQELARFEFYYLYFSKDNAVHYIPHPMFDVAPPAAVMEFTGDFCVGRPTVQINAQKKVSQVVLWATDEDGRIYTSTYPVSPSDEGTPLEMRKVRVGGGAGAAQARLDLLVRRAYDWHNRDYTVTWTVPGLAGFLFELMDRVALTYDGPTEPAGVHVNWNDKKFWIHQIRMRPELGFAGQTAFLLEEEPTISPAP